GGWRSSASSSSAACTRTDGAAPVDRVRVVGGIADREEAGRERKPASIDEAPETVAKLSHDEDGRLLACDRDRGAARAPRRDGRKGAQEALEARWFGEAAQRMVVDRRADRDREGAAVAGEDGELHPPEVARDQPR